MDDAKSAGGNDTWLGRWLRSADRSPAPYPFSVVDVVEIAEPDDAIRESISLMLCEEKATLEVLRDLESAIGWSHASARVRRSRTRELAVGDFGEALVNAHLEAEHGLTIPVRKLRFQIDPEQSLHGTDHIALEFDGRSLTSIHFLEAKTRTGHDTTAAVNAHKQLVEANAERFGDVLQFLLERLREQGGLLYSAVMEYLRERGGSRRDRFGIYLVQEGSAFSEKSLSNLNEYAEELLDPLRVTAVRINSLRELIDDSWDGISAELVNG